VGRGGWEGARRSSVRVMLKKGELSKKGELESAVLPRLGWGRGAGD
jgi:hypothetical protein